MTEPSQMIRPVSVIERAFKLAECQPSLDMIRSTLKKEGYSSVDAHLAGRQIRADLSRIMGRND